MFVGVRRAEGVVHLLYGFVFVAFYVAANGQMVFVARDVAHLATERVIGGCEYARFSAVELHSASGIFLPEA